MHTYEQIDELSAEINGDAKALQTLLDDMHGEADPDRLHAAIVVANHLQEMAHELSGAVSGES